MRIPVIADLAELLQDIAYYRRKKALDRLDREQPIQLIDPVLGTFTFWRELGWFQMTKMWNGIEVQVDLSGDWPDTAPDLELAAKMAQAARVFWSDESGWLDRLEDCAMRDLLELAIEWQAETGPVSPAQFRQRITAKSLGIGEQDFEVWFADGDLFWGHEILVYGNWKDGPLYAEMHG